MKKPRSDSKLKSLPPETQDAVYAWATTPKSEECSGGLEYAREQLAQDGVRVSLRALSEFVSWYQLAKRFERASSRASQIAELIAEKSPDMEPERVREIGQAIFTLEAVDSGNAQQFVALESLKLAQDSARARADLEREKLSLAERRVRVMEAKLEEARGILTDGSLSTEEREQRMKSCFGISG